MTPYERAPAIADPARLDAVRTGTSGGLRLWRFVRERARVVVRTGMYSPGIYAHAATWTDEAIDDLALEVFAGPLYGEGQYRYAMEHAGDLKHFRALIDLHIRRTLGDRVEGTIVGRLGLRAVHLMEKNPEEFDHIDWRGHARAFSLAGRIPPPEDRFPTPGDIEEAALAVGGADRRTRDRTRDPEKRRRGEDTRVHPAGRAGPGAVVHTYSNDQLHEILLRIGGTLPCLFRRRDVEMILGILLGDEGTEPFIEEPPPGDEETREAAEALKQQRAMAPAISPSATLIAERAADIALGRMSPRARQVLSMRLDEDRGSSDAVEPGTVGWVSDAAIARALGCDRKVVARAQAEAVRVIREEFDGLPAVAIPLAERALIERILRPAE